MVVVYVLTTFLVTRSGGTLSLSMFNLGVVVLFAYLLTGLVAGVFWTVIVFITTIVIKLMTEAGVDFGSAQPTSKTIVAIFTLLIVSTIIAVLFELSNRNNARKFEAEREQSRQTAAEQKELLDDANGVMNAVARGDLTREISVEIEGELGALITVAK